MNCSTTICRGVVTSLRDPGHPFGFYQSLDFAGKSLPRVFLTGAHLDGYPPVWPQQAVVVKDGDHAREKPFAAMWKKAVPESKFTTGFRLNITKM
jgi:hypothetical protein